MTLRFEPKEVFLVGFQIISLFRVQILNKKIKTALSFVIERDNAKTRKLEAIFALWLSNMDIRGLWIIFL